MIDDNIFNPTLLQNLGNRTIMSSWLEVNQQIVMPGNVQEGMRSSHTKEGDKNFYQNQLRIWKTCYLKTKLHSPVLEAEHHQILHFCTLVTEHEKQYTKIGSRILSKQKQTKITVTYFLSFLEANEREQTYVSSAWRS